MIENQKVYMDTFNTQCKSSKSIGKGYGPLTFINLNPCCLPCSCVTFKYLNIRTIC